MIEIVSRIYPTGFRDRVRRLLVYDGLDYDLDEFISSVTLITFSSSALLSLLAFAAYSISLWLTFPLVVILLLICSYTYLVLRADRRGRFVEGVLPEALRLIASNMRAGLTIDRSVVLSARPEFGFFSWELKRVAGKVISGESFEDALKEMGVRVKSKNLEATIELLVQGLRGGSNISNALDRIADVLSDREFVKKEVRTGVEMYVWFIIFAMLGGAPLLFAISSFLVEVLTQLQSSIGNVDVTLLKGLPGARLPLSVEFIRTFSIASLFTTSATGSVVIALIQSGNWKNGLKNIPLFCLISIVLFLMVGRVLGSLFAVTGVVH